MLFAAVCGFETILRHMNNAPLCVRRAGRKAGSSRFCRWSCVACTRWPRRSWWRSNACRASSSASRCVGLWVIHFLQASVCTWLHIEALHCLFPPSMTVLAPQQYSSSFSARPNKAHGAGIAPVLSVGIICCKLLPKILPNESFLCYLCQCTSKD